MLQGGGWACVAKHPVLHHPCANDLKPPEAADWSSRCSGCSDFLTNLTILKDTTHTAVKNKLHVISINNRNVVFKMSECTPLTNPIQMILIHLLIRIWQVWLVRRKYAKKRTYFHTSSHVYHTKSTKQNVVEYLFLDV